MEQPYISKSYKKGLTSFILLAIAFFLVALSSPLGDSVASSSQFDENLTIESLTVVIIGAFIGLLGILAMVFALIGMIQLRKGWKEARNYKFYVALIGNGIGFVFFIYFIINLVRLIYAKIG